MTLAAARKMTSRLTPAEKLIFAEELIVDSDPSLPRNAFFAEIERRAKKIISGKRKTLSKKDFDQDGILLLWRIRQAQAFHAARY